jgi:predicted amidohydrolase
VSVRVALIQTRTPATQAAAFEHIAPLIEQAVVGGAELIATPEGSNLLQRSRSKFVETATPAEDDVFVTGVRDLARGHGVHILIGSALVRREDGLFANRAMLVTPTGEVSATYDKIHMFDVDLPTGERHRESNAYAPGDRAVLAQTPFGPLGLTICYDVRFPHLYRALAQAGAKIIAVPAAFTVPTGQAHWEILLRARAIENGAFIIAPAQGGTHEDGRATYGHSLVIAPWGEVVARSDDDAPGEIFADLDLDEADNARAAIPNLVNGREFSQP